MAADVVTPLLQHALDVGQVFTDNACLKNGVTRDPRRYVVGQQPDVPAVAAAPPATNATNQQSNWPTWAKNAVIGAAALSAGAGGAGLVKWFSSKPATEQPPAVIEAAPKDGSLLQYLQDRGYHLPPEERK